MSDVINQLIGIPLLRNVLHVILMNPGTTKPMHANVAHHQDWFKQENVYARHLKLNGMLTAKLVAAQPILLDKIVKLALLQDFGMPI